MGLIGKLSDSKSWQETIGNAGIVGESVEIGGRHKLITLCHLGSLRVTQKRISRLCVSGATSERLSKASSLRSVPLLYCLGMDTALFEIGLCGAFNAIPQYPIFLLYRANLK